MRRSRGGKTAVIKCHRWTKVNIIPIGQTNQELPIFAATPGRLVWDWRAKLNLSHFFRQISVSTPLELQGVQKPDVERKSFRPGRTIVR